MTSIPMLSDQAENPSALLLLAHGSGLPMDSPFMADVAARIAARGVTVLRFEFPYMSDRRTGGSKRPPPRAEKLCDFYQDAITQVRREMRENMQLLIGGKSLGGRVASLVADEEYSEARIQGLVCLGYPFHPPKKPENLRTLHLEGLTCPTLICQGTRDPLGTQDEIATYELSDAIQISWVGDGDHDFKPRKKSGFTNDQNLQDAAEAVVSFVASLSNAV